MTKNIGKSISGVMLTLVAGTATSTGLASQPNPDKRLQQVHEVLGSFGKNGADFIGMFAQDGRYTEHDPASPLGRKILNPSLRLYSTAQRVTIVRAFSDGDFVVTQSDYNFGDRLIVFDVFRFDGEHIVEHWANVQKTCDSPNFSGRTQLDGPTQVTDLEATETNKASVNAYFRDVVFGARANLAPQYKNVATSTSITA